MTSPDQSLWHALPIVGFVVSEWQDWREDVTSPRERLAPAKYEGTNLPPYPIDLVTEIVLPHGTLDEAGVPYNTSTPKYPAAYQPSTIAQYALAHWNAYLATGEEKHKQAFMTQAHWLLEHETRLTDNASGWLIPYPMPDYYTSGPWLSGLTQGNAISVLVRAYRLTGDDVFLEVARRAIRTFELDIRDGGVSTSVGEDGIFFEEVAVYPAAHILNGYVFALLGLYDYVAITNDERIAALIRRSLAAMHTLIDEFDTGYWSYYDLLIKPLAPRYYHALHVTMLEVLARYSGCEHCAALAAKWDRYQGRLGSRWRYSIMSRITRYQRGLQRLGIRGVVFRILAVTGQTAPKSARLPITGSENTHDGR